MAGAGLFAFCIFKGNPYNFADRIRKDNLLRPLGNWFEHFAKIQKLMGGQMHPFRTDLSGNGNQRGTIAVGVGHAGNQVSSSRPQR